MARRAASSRDIVRPFLNASAQTSSPAKALPPSASSEADQATSSADESTVSSATARPTSSTATAVSDCSCTSTPITIIGSPPTIGGDRRADRPHLRQQPHSYQVTLGGLGTAAAT